jgi:hypothetical protein
MRRWGTIFVILTTAAILFAATKDLTLEQLKERLESAKPDDRATISIQIAERQVENANKLYGDSKSEEAVSAIHEVVSYSEKARDAASQTGHRLKNIEIAVRRMSRRLANIKRTLAYDDQATVQEAVERLDKIDTDLLNRMFGKNPK